MNKLIVAIVFCLGNVALAGTLEQVTAADCTSQAGSYVRINLKAQSLEAKFAGLPAMSNSHEGEHMPVEFQTEAGHTLMIGLAVDEQTSTFGSVALAAETGKNLSSDEKLLAVFRDMQGLVKTEVLQCTMSFK